MLSPIRLGAVLLDPPLLQAPMEGISDVIFRRTLRRIGGVGLTCTEFVPAKGLPAARGKLREMVAVDEGEHPVAVQLYGRDPEVLAQGARHVVEDLGADVVDLNMGCPSKQVVAHSGGASLMRDPALVREIVGRVRAAVRCPLTVKMRAGWDDDALNAPEIASICEGEGADLVTVHWRTKAQGYGGTRRWDTVGQVVSAVKIPVVANGDILGIAEAREALEQTGAAGLMVGRGAVRDPWTFAQIAAWGRGAPFTPPTVEERVAVWLAYLEAYREQSRSDKGALGRFKQLSKFYALAVPGADALRQDLLRCHATGEAAELIHRWAAPRVSGGA
ncbi:MAG: tRNA-dihydrouridine synthase [Deltaproteobacteria bacterium]|nr:tRNA-dihydrouridine synthase [Deltaproteobacteria bacterium]